MRSSLVLTTGFIAAATAQNSSSDCVTGDAVHFIIARASQELPGPGIIGGVATDITNQLPGSTMESVDYPATLANYQASEAKGVSEMTRLVTDYTSRCPNSKLVLMGYSQGAQVTADMLCGTNENTFAATDALARNISDKVTAVVLMGDPSKSSKESFLAGTSTKDGVFPRSSTSGCDSLKDRMISYCNANDTFCDSGSSIQVHISYVQDNGTNAADFVVKQVKGGLASSGSAGSGPSTNMAGLAFSLVGLALGWLVIA